MAKTKHTFEVMMTGFLPSLMSNSHGKVDSRCYARGRIPRVGVGLLGGGTLWPKADLSSHPSSDTYYRSLSRSPPLPDPWPKLDPIVGGWLPNLAQSLCVKKFNDTLYALLMKLSFSVTSPCSVCFTKFSST